MNDNRYFVRQIISYVVAGLSIIAVVMMLTVNLLNGAQDRAQAENAALSSIPRPHR